jgi:hypothetical protein
VQIQIPPAFVTTLSTRATPATPSVPLRKHPRTFGFLILTHLLARSLTHSQSSAIKSSPSTQPLTRVAPTLSLAKISAWVPKVPTATPRMSTCSSHQHQHQHTPLTLFRSYVVQPGDTCLGIEATHGINSTQLYVRSLHSPTEFLLLTLAAGQQPQH